MNTNPFMNGLPSAANTPAFAHVRPTYTNEPEPAPPPVFPSAFPYLPNAFTWPEANRQVGLLLGQSLQQ